MEFKKISNYAEAAMNVYRNRYCLAKLGKDFEPSADHAYYCDTKINKADKSGHLLDHL